GDPGRLPRARTPPRAEASRRHTRTGHPRTAARTPAARAPRRTTVTTCRLRNLWPALAAVLFAGPVPAHGQSLELVQTIELKGKAGKLDHLTLDVKRERLFLANTANATLDVVDLKAAKLLKQVPGQT